MSRNKLASKIAKLEAGKSEVEIGNVRSVLKYEAKIMAQEAVDANVNNEDPADVFPIDSISYVELAEAVSKEITRLLKKKK